jgi:uncharacterized protein YndB with AHSA1/START domain
VPSGRARSFVLAVAAFGFSTPGVAEVTRSTDDSFVSRHEVVVEASPKAVWLALISPAGWWRADHTWSGDAANLSLTPQAGGCFCETIPEVDEPGRFTLQGSVEHMRVIQAYPEQALRMQGALGPLQSEPVIGVLTIAITKVEQGTRIVWEYNVGGPMRYEVPVISKAVDGVMGLQVAALGELLGPVAFPEPEPSEAGSEASEVEVQKSAAPAAPDVKAKPAPAAPVSAPTIKPSPTLTAPPAGVPPTKPAASPAPKAATPPAPTPKPAPKPAVKPDAKAGAVDDAFGDLKDDNPGV